MAEKNLNLKARVPSSTSNDTIKKLIYSASILVKQLDSAVGKAKSCRDLFTPEVIELRSQLSYLCVKSMGADPLQCRRRAEELLWKKCYYDVITSAKISGKKCHLSSMEKLFIGNHIEAGIVKFTELMQDVWRRLEDMDPSLKLQLNVLPLLEVKYQNYELSKETREDLMESAQKILVWLGDLSRYRNDLEISNSVITSERFYRQAILFNSNNGLPYNQLGTLTSHDPSRAFESIFYYTRSLKASKVFPGADPNLKALLARLVTNEDKLISTFSQLFPKLVFVVKEETTFEVSQLCQVTLGEIQKRLGSSENGSCNQLLDLASSVMMCTLTPTLATNNNQTAAIAFCCSLFVHVLNRFQEIFHMTSRDASNVNGNQTHELKYVDPNAKEEMVDELSDEEEEESKRAKLRRRKVASGSSDQDFSEEELFLDSNSEQESEDDEVLSDSGFHSAEAKVESLLEIPHEATRILPIFKLLTDWFRVNVEIVQVSNQTIRKIWSTLADILNVFKRCQRENVSNYGTVPLEEDWKFYGVNSMSSVHAQIDFESAPAPSNVLILNSIRIERILQFGNWLASQNNEKGFQLVNGIYTCPVDAVSDKSEGLGAKADLVMRNMAHLWLKSEVQELERRLSPKQKRKKKTNFDFSGLSYVYLVPDVSALSNFTYLIKQVIKSQKLIIVVPDIVISEIDQLKRESAPVRECIRWLESCFRTGNRFIRAQRQNEHQVIPLLTYPKRKDKAQWTLFQILECCYYLDTNQRNVYKTGQNSPIVLFLTGDPVEETEQQTRAICNSIGVEYKSADSLMRKSKTKKR
ncbi:hypothetical protein GHT06_007871 [Daphnia sinensis]|uniref:Protein SMG5 n=1 Tax=Daphnia sinensis TaxID=1820382 RepID=A0AAD5Q050_9CRUS|nr:hypothetical protein GHT06_007871 [Daphnia sinensis]